MRVAAFIPARGGSKRIPRKNLERVGRHTLVGHAIGCADLAELSPIVLSTDDDVIWAAVRNDAVRSCAQWWRMDRAQWWRMDRVEIHERPPHLASDTAQIEAAAIHWLRHCNAKGPAPLAPDDALVILQPTSPLRTAETVRRCVEVMREHACDSVLTVTMDRKWRFRGGRCHEVADGVYRAIWDRPDGWKRPRTQDVRPAPEENGCVYVVRVGHLLRTRSRMGGRELVVPIGPIEAWDVDTPEDLDVARAMWRIREGES